MKKKKKQFPRPIFKSFNKRSAFLKWVVSHFPESYIDLVYVEPFSISLIPLLNKEKSQVELININDKIINNIYKSLRNESSNFTKKLNRYKFCEETFKKVKKSSELKKESYFDASLEEYILRNMSTLELRSKFSKSNLSSWKKDIVNLSLFSSRIKESFIVNDNPFNIIKDFNFDNTFLFCDPPHLYELKKGKTVYDSNMPVNEHINLSHILNSFKGKVILSGVVSPLYSRMYKNWNFFKSKYKNKNGKLEVIWKNF